MKKLWDAFITGGYWLDLRRVHAACPLGALLHERGTGDDTKEMGTAPGLTTMRSPSSAAITASPTVVKVPRPEASGPTHTRCSFTAVIPSVTGTLIPLQNLKPPRLCVRVEISGRTQDLRCFISQEKVMIINMYAFRSILRK